LGANKVKPHRLLSQSPSYKGIRLSKVSRLVEYKTVMADRTKKKLQQQERRASLSEEQKIDEKEKHRIRTARNRLKKKTNDNDNEPPASLLPDESVLEPAAAFTPSFSDNAVETPEPFTSSSSSHLKKSKIIEDDIIVDEEIQESKSYNFFQHIPQSDSSSNMTDQQVLISSITQNVQPPTEVRNVEY